MYQKNCKPFVFFGTTRTNSKKLGDNLVYSKNIGTKEIDVFKLFNAHIEAQSMCIKNKAELLELVKKHMENKTDITPQDLFTIIDPKRNVYIAEMHARDGRPFFRIVPFDEANIIKQRIKMGLEKKWESEEQKKLNTKVRKEYADMKKKADDFEDNIPEPELETENEIENPAGIINNIE